MPNALCRRWWSKVVCGSRWALLMVAYWNLVCCACILTIGSRHCQGVLAEAERRFPQGVDLQIDIDGSSRFMHAKQEVADWSHGWDLLLVCGCG